MEKLVRVCSFSRGLPLLRTLRLNRIRVCGNVVELLANGLLTGLWPNLQGFRKIGACAFGLRTLRLNRIPVC
eukprot:28889-Eustigmatos_ZCMA.PRE.1